jgi:hypothetical protein
MRYVLAAIASVLYFALVGFVSLIPMMGDCFPTSQHVCPSDAHRYHSFLVIWAIGLLIYFVLGWFLLRGVTRR